MKQYKEYKESGAEWIGEIPTEWSITKLKYLAKIKNGRDQKEVLSDNGIFPILGTGGEFGRASSYLHDKPSVLLGRKGTVDKPQFIEEPFWTVDTLFYTEIFDNTIPKYLFYLTTLIPFGKLQESSAIPSMTQDKLHNVVLCRPTIKEQKIILDFISYHTTLIDTLITKKEQLIEKLKEQRQAIINEAVTKGLNPNVKMKDSGIAWLGEIPFENRLVPIRYLCEKVGSGVTPKGGGEVYTEDGIIFIRSQNVYNEGLQLNDVVRITRETHDKMLNSKVIYQDVLLNITGASIGRVCLVDMKGEMNVNQHVCILRTNEKIIPKFLELILQSEIGQIQIKLGTTGGNREGLTFEAIKRFVLPIPTLETQTEIINKVTTVIERFVSLETVISKQITKLTSYRQSLISEAVTGKIDVQGCKLTNP